MEISSFWGFFLISVVKFSFLVIDDGKDPYTHHLPAGCAENCILCSGSGLGCRLIVQAATITTKASTVLQHTPDQKMKPTAAKQ
jgi:hypothetical protein